MARILLVHGAFAGAWCWEPALPGLRDGGHSLEAIDLPGAGEDTTPVAEVTLDAYGKKICRALSEGPPAILAGQSMGGMAITQAAARCPEHVRALIYIAAFAPAEGQSLVELVSYPEAAGDQVQANVIVEGDPPSGHLTRDGAVVAMLNCCTEEQVNWAVPRLGPQPVAPWAGKVVVEDGERAAFEALPRAYILLRLGPLDSAADAAPDAHRPRLRSGTRDRHRSLAMGVADRRVRPRDERDHQHGGVGGALVDPTSADRQEGLHAMAGLTCGPAVAWPVP